MSLQHPRIVFAGTPDFAVPALERLLAAGHRVVAVYTQPDRPAGRGRGLQESPVKRLALAHELPVRQPANFRIAGAIDELRALEPDLMVVAAYGLILPQAVLDVPSQGCWNIHASLLPRWRGAAPIQRAIEAGDEETGVCIMRMEAGLDTGPVFHAVRTPIDPEDTGGSLHDRLAVLGADALLHCLGMAARGRLPTPQPQDEQRASYAPKLTKDEARLDFKRSAIELERVVRAFNPWPVAWFEGPLGRLRVWRARASSEAANAPPGQVTAAGPADLQLATGRGVLRLLEVQAAGGRRLPVADFLNARTIRIGDQLVEP
jgi:methionyl-tRNA formyltransferase